MHFMSIKLSLLLLFNLLALNKAENCHDDPVMFDDEFVGCCRGRPKYTSELCIDELLENNTLSSECIVNCIYRQFGLYDGKTINMTSVKAFLEAEISQDEFGLIYLNAFEKCSKLDKEAIAEKFSFIEHPNEYACDEYPPLVDVCVWYHTLANCPQSYASDSESCSKKGQWVNECLFEIN